jgi:hypothetical protein
VIADLPFGVDFFCGKANSMQTYHLGFIPSMVILGNSQRACCRLHGTEANHWLASRQPHRLTGASGTFHAITLQI